MKIYLQSVDYHLWLNVCWLSFMVKCLQSSYILMKIVNNIGVSKLAEFDEHDMTKCSFNASAINCFYCALSSDEFNKVSVFFCKWNLENFQSNSRGNKSS